MNIYKADRNGKYYKIIQMYQKYRDGRFFPIDEIVECDTKVDLMADDYKKIGGFFISNYEWIFRWIIRGDTLCEVKIPNDSSIYRVEGKVKAFVANKIILTNPQKLDDDFVNVLYENSNLPENEYFRALAACSVKGYIKTATKLVTDKVNKSNINICIEEFKAFCERRNLEYNTNTFEIEAIKKVIAMLNNIKNN